MPTESIVLAAGGPCGPCMIPVGLFSTFLAPETISVRNLDASKTQYGYSLNQIDDLPRFQNVMVNVEGYQQCSKVL